jgi:hypothetical protein
LLADDWPTQWVPFTVVVQPNGDVIELVAEGHLDSWTVGALVRNLAAVYEPAYSEIHLDLRNVVVADPIADAGVARCRAFATERGAAFRVTPPVPLDTAPATARLFSVPVAPAV